MFAASALATSDQPPDFGPVFVGGSGRSGTTIVSRLLGTHSRLARIRTEARFDADDRHGLIGLLRGRQDLAGFLAWMRSPDAWGRLASVIAPGELDRVL